MPPCFPQICESHLHKINTFLAFAPVVSGVSRVTNLMCVGPNRTNAEIWLSWKKAAGLSTAVIIQVDNQNYTVPSNSCSSEEWCNYTVSNLKYYTEYRVDVWTQSSGQYSPSVVRDCITGITGQSSILHSHKSFFADQFSRTFLKSPSFIQECTPTEKQIHTGFFCLSSIQIFKSFCL